MRKRAVPLARMASLSSDPSILTPNLDHPLVHQRVKIIGLNLQEEQYNVPAGIDVGWVESFDESFGLYRVVVHTTILLLDATNLAAFPRLDGNREFMKKEVANNAMAQDDRIFTDPVTGREHKFASCNNMDCTLWGITKIDQVSPSTVATWEHAVGAKLGVGDPTYCPRLHQCKRCHDAYYCSTECQTLHWEYHKPTCKTGKQCHRIEKMMRTNLLANYLLFENYYFFATKAAIGNTKPRMIVRFCCENRLTLEELTVDNLVMDDSFRLQANTIHAFAQLLETSHKDAVGGVEESPYSVALSNGRSYDPVTQCVFVIELANETAVHVKSFIIDRMDTSLTRKEIIAAEVTRMQAEGIIEMGLMGWRRSHTGSATRVKKIKPNAKCPCGSGKKIKKCCR